MGIAKHLQERARPSEAKADPESAASLERLYRAAFIQRIQRPLSSSS